MHNFKNMKAIYKTSLKSTGRVVYVGQTTRIGIIGKYYFGGGKMMKQIPGSQQREMFATEIITTTESKAEANELERYYIDYYCTLEEYGGFNIAPGGRGKTGADCRSGKNNSMYGRTGGSDPAAKRCMYNGIEFECIKYAYIYAETIGVSKSKCRKELIIL